MITITNLWILVPSFMFLLLIGFFDYKVLRETNKCLMNIEDYAAAGELWPTLIKFFVVSIFSIVLLIIFLFFLVKSIRFA